MLLGAKADITAFRRSNFPGESHPSTHTPIVDPALFDAAGKILTTRGQDISKRASNASDYLLTGLIVCAGCGKHYLGTAATGRRYRYRYYTCYSRNRYGTAVCTGVRLPADALEAAVLDSLVATYARKDLIDDAVRAAHAASTAGRDRVAEQLAALNADISKTEAAVERYLCAFESGALTEGVCGQRVQHHAHRLTDLRTRRAALQADLDSTTVAAPTAADLDQLRRRIREALDTGPDHARKTVLQELVHEIRVESRRCIRPTFRVPDQSPSSQPAVREPYRSVELRGLEPLTPTLPVWCATSCATAPYVRHHTRTRNPPAGRRRPPPQARIPYRDSRQRP